MSSLCTTVGMASPAVSTWTFSVLVPPLHAAIDIDLERDRTRAVFEGPAHANAVGGRVLTKAPQPIREEAAREHRLRNWATRWRPFPISQSVDKHRKHRWNGLWKQHRLIMNLPVHSPQAIHIHSLDGGS
jgi:hypothetical protein